MIRSVEIEGYRGFSHYRMGELGRINLLVGKNNCGKTSILEAIQLLTSGGGAPYALAEICFRRGETIVEDREARLTRDSEIDVSHLFRGHDLSIGNRFGVSAADEGLKQLVDLSVEELSEGDLDPRQLPLAVKGGGMPSRFALRLKTTLSDTGRVFPLSLQGGLDSDYIDFPGLGSAWRQRRQANKAVHFIPSGSLSGEALIRIWERVQLTPQEKLVLTALQFIDKDILEVRATLTGGSYGDRGGFIIKRRNESMPFPLGSMGDGAWRMLAMAIVITQCAGGTLLVDEIDTGLHYTVMEDMWKLIHGAAKEFNVQVFATTHSNDCVHSLASICRDGVEHGTDVTIQRIEADRHESVSFTEEQIRVAADRQIEIR